MKFSIKDFFSKCGQIRRKMSILSHLLNKSLMENFIFCEVVLKFFVSKNMHFLELLLEEFTSKIIKSAVEILLTWTPSKITWNNNHHQRRCIEIGALKNFTKFTGKHQYNSLFFNSYRPKRVLKACLENVKKEFLTQNNLGTSQFWLKFSLIAKISYVYHKCL